MTFLRCPLEAPIAPVACSSSRSYDDDDDGGDDDISGTVLGTLGRHTYIHRISAPTCSLSSKLSRSCERSLCSPSPSPASCAAGVQGCSGQACDPSSGGGGGLVPGEPTWVWPVSGGEGGGGGKMEGVTTTDPRPQLADNVWCKLMCG